MKEARLVAAVPFPPELQRAALVAAGGVGLGVVVLFTRLPSVLPDYPALILALLLWAVLPGWLAQQALFGDRTTTFVERVVVSFLMSVALAALPGLVALRLHWSLDTFAIAYVVVAAVVSGLSLFWHRADDEVPALERNAPGALPGGALLVALLGLAALAIATSPWWAGDRVPRDGDDLVYMAYVTNYADSGSLDASQPFLDTRQGGFGRMAVNVWVVMQALLAKSAGVSPAALLFDLLPPLLTLLAVAAMFTLARGLSGSTTLALLASAFVLAFAALDLSPHEGYGRNILVRIAQDKMIATYVLLPLGLLMGASFVVAPSVKRYLAAVLAFLALLVVHPMGVLFLGIGLGSFAGLRSVTERSLAPARSGLALLGPAALAGGLWAGQSLDSSLDQSGPFREAFRFVDVPGGLRMASHHVILHPFIMGAALLGTAAWLIAPRNAGTQLVFAATAAPLVISFVPPLATPLASLASEHALWRLPYLIPVPLALAYGYPMITRRLAAAGSDGGATGAGGRFGALAPAGFLVLLIAAAVVIQEQYAVLDDGQRYERFSTTEILPWTGGSILLGGYEHAGVLNARPSEEIQGVLDFLEANVPPGSTVLLPRLASRYLPALLPELRAADYRSQTVEFGERRDFVTAFYLGLERGEQLREELRTFDIDVVIVEAGSRGELSLRTFAAYGADEFTARTGAPDLELRGMRSRYWAWALDADNVERIDGPGFTVPEDIDPQDMTLELEIIVAPSREVDVAGVARVGVLYSGGPDNAPAEASFTNVEIPGGTAAGTWILRRRFLPTDVRPGTYAIGVRRMGDHDLDTYPADLWVVGLRLKYQIAMDQIDQTKYRAYVVPGGSPSPDG